MDPIQQNIFLSFSSAAAQVWSALMVFHILLVRDQLAHKDRQLDALWAECKVWWRDLLGMLLNPNPGSLNEHIREFGLTEEVLLRADTDRNAFKAVILAIKNHKIPMHHRCGAATIGKESVAKAAWQGKFDPIAEQVEQIEARRPKPHFPFFVGIAGVASNLIWLSEMNRVDGWFGSLSLTPLLVLNLALGAIFFVQVYRSLVNRT